MIKFKFVLNIKTNIISLKFAKKRLIKQFRQKKSKKIVIELYKKRLNVELIFYNLKFLSLKIQCIFFIIIILTIIQFI